MLQLEARATARIFSYGGGTQSTAVLVMQALGMLRNPYDVFVFANTGDDSEHPEVRQYLDTVMHPFAEKHDIEIIEVRKTTWGEPETLLEYAYRTERSIPIPMFLASGAPGNRTCTQDFKIKVVDKWIKKQKFKRAVVGLGISLDEFQRMRDVRWHDRHGSRAFGFWKRCEYPLIDQRIRRADCIRIVMEAGLPKPPRSACWFCPFQSRARWIELKNHHPDLFQQAIELEKMLNEKRAALGRDAMHLHRDRVPLQDAVGDQMSLLDLIDAQSVSCDSGSCFT